MAKETPTKEDVFAKRKAKIEEKKKDKSVQKISSELKATYLDRFGEAKFKEFNQMADGRDLIYLKVESSLAVLRPPTAEDLGEYMMAIAETNMSEAGRMIIEKLWLDGDLDLIDDEDKYISIFLQMSNLLEGKKGEFFRG